MKNAPEPFELVLTQMHDNVKFTYITDLAYTYKRICSDRQNCLRTFRRDSALELVVLLHKEKVYRSFTWPKSKSGPKYSERLNGSKPANCSQLNDVYHMTKTYSSILIQGFPSQYVVEIHHKTI